MQVGRPSYSYEYTGLSQMKHFSEGGGGGINFSRGGYRGQVGRVDVAFLRLTHSTSAPSFTKVFLWAAASAFTALFFSSKQWRASNCSLASFVIVRPGVPFNFASGSAFLDYHTQAGGPSVSKPAASRQQGPLGSRRRIRPPSGISLDSSGGST